MTFSTSEIIWAPAIPPEKGGYPGLNPRTEHKAGMIIEYDVAVPMRDGVRIYIDVFRPETSGQYPPLIAWGPYGKHGLISYDGIGNTLLNDSDFNEFTRFEAADPIYWCRNGYVVINADMRGSWASEGELTWMSEQEVDDMYDLIEWAGTQPWSNGKVGMHGVSYLAWSQWKVAAARPPHLACINPWEGVSDFYRELAMHGGIPDTLFCPMWQSNVHYSTTRVEDFVAMQKARPLFDEWWQSKNADLSKITVPAFVVACWADHGLHCRGTIEGFKQISSEHKWLLVHGRKKWWHLYQPENVEKQRQFFNRFLKDIEIDNHVMEWPRVTLEIREKFFIGDLRSENEWPIARTQYTRYYLDATNGTLSTKALKKEAAVTYNADRYYSKDQNKGNLSPFFLDAIEQVADKLAKEKPSGRQNAVFEVEFPERTELTGHMKLRLWVEADGSDDMDLFVALDKVDTAGYRVPLVYFANHNDGPIALGWLRVSHRELDEAKSTPYQPVHLHQRELKLKPGETVPVDVEIWPTSILFEKGEKLRLTIQGRDIYYYPSEAHTCGHTDTVNRGNHVIHTGGKYDSHLLAAVIPPR
ncbi:MAG: CocE/NonD family hydrolase [Actinobacteria bacterium]|nr:CocE/NonD family hydrolase [Actinomycetota bacterium]